MCRSEPLGFGSAHKILSFGGKEGIYQVLALAPFLSVHKEDLQKGNLCRDCVRKGKGSLAGDEGVASSADKYYRHWTKSHY